MNIKTPTKENIIGLRTLWKEAFGDTDDFLDAFFSTAFSFDRAFCIEENSDILAALYYFECTFENQKIAYIYAVATAKKLRSKGLCRMLMEHTHQSLKAKGFKGAILVPGSKSLFDFYEKMGYKTCCYIDKQDFTASKTPISLRKLTHKEYASLRYDFLPENSVIQEGESLDFLSTYAEVYAGANFIFSATKDGDKLICHELLGSIKSAPDILCTLGCKKGHFRTPGSTSPFAMYLPFEEANFPAYFGFAFD